MTDKKKHTARLKPYKDDEIHREDARTFFIKDYMIYRDQNDRWLCDCLDFVMNIEDNGNTKECKHIERVKKEFRVN